MKQRRWIQTALLACSSLLALSAFANDWPQFLGPDRNGTTDESIATKFRSSLTVWATNVGAGFSGPVVQNQSVILFQRVDDQEVIEARSVADGKLLWKAAHPTAYRDSFGFDEGPRATPTVMSNRVFALGANGNLHAFSFLDGKKLWSVDCQKQFGARPGFFGFACSPLVVDGMVVVNIGGENGAGIVALDAETGTLKWKTTKSEASYSSPVLFGTGAQRRIAVFTRDGLVSLGIKDGRVDWDFPWRASMNASVNAATPIVIGEQIFISSSYDTGAVLLELAEGKPKVVWKNDDSLSNHYSTSVEQNGFLFGFHGRQEEKPSLRCVELRTGKIQWSEDGFGSGHIVATKNALLILRESGELVMAKPGSKAFERIGSVQVLGFDCRAAPAFSNGRLFARDKRRLIALDLKP